MVARQQTFFDAEIVVVDDHAENVRHIQRVLDWAGYLNVKLITDSSEAISAIRSGCTDLVILDLHMPKPDGYEVLETIRHDEEIDWTIPVLVFTGDDRLETKKRAFQAGASDFLAKPGDASEILMRVGNYLQTRKLHLQLRRNNLGLEEVVRERTAALASSRREALEALARVSEFRDDETGHHTRRVGELSADIAKQLGVPEEFVEALRLTAPLHDIGKVAIPDSVLLKPGKLECHEFELMKRHTVVGGKVFASIESPLMIMARDIAVHHHERWDGSGYPCGIAGESIPLAARIVAVADVFDALVHKRSYKEAWSDEDAVAELVAQKGRQFDPRVVSAFVRVWDSTRMAHAA